MPQNHSSLQPRWSLCFLSLHVSFLWLFEGMNAQKTWGTLSCKKVLFKCETCLTNLYWSFVIKREKPKGEAGQLTKRTTLQRSVMTASCRQWLNEGVRSCVQTAETSFLSRLSVRGRVRRTELLVLNIERSQIRGMRHLRSRGLLRSSRWGVLGMSGCEEIHW